MLSFAMVTSLAAGCSVGNGGSPLALTRERTGEQAVLAPEGGVIGVDDDCVTLRQQGDSPSVTLAWPQDSTSWNADRRSVMFDGTVIGDGDVISVTGSSDQPPGGWHEPPDDECPKRVWFVGAVEEMGARR